VDRGAHGEASDFTVALYRYLEEFERFPKVLEKEMDERHRVIVEFSVEIVNGTDNVNSEIMSLQTLRKAHRPVLREVALGYSLLVIITEDIPVEYSWIELSAVAGAFQKHGKYPLCFYPFGVFNRDHTPIEFHSINIETVVFYGVKLLVPLLSFFL